MCNCPACVAPTHMRLRRRRARPHQSATLGLTRLLFQMHGHHDRLEGGTGEVFTIYTLFPIRLYIPFTRLTSSRISVQLHLPQVSTATMADVAFAAGSFGSNHTLHAAAGSPFAARVAVFDAAGGISSLRQDYG